MVSQVWQVKWEPYFPFLLEWGDSGFLNPSEEAEQEYINSTNATQQLTEAIFMQKGELNIDEERQKTIISGIKQNKSERFRTLYNQTKENVSFT